jgi:hypothetical protein
LEEDAFYFSNSDDISIVLNTDQAASERLLPVESFYGQRNLEKIKQQYNWANIIDEYEKFILQCVNEKKK